MRFVIRLYAKCIPCFTDCTIAELEKLGPKYRLALRVAKDPRWTRLQCDHSGTYADDCIVDRVSDYSGSCDLEKSLTKNHRYLSTVSILLGQTIRNSLAASARFLVCRL